MTRAGKPAPTWNEAWQRLQEGNARYVAARMQNPNQTPECRRQLVEGQNPFAVVLGCADSRVPPEVIFDQGLGDLFVLRVAGHAVGQVVLASIEYAVAHLSTPLVVVLGHSHCGAVTAAVEGAAAEGHLPRLASLIAPAIEQATGQEGDRIELTARAHARLAAEQLVRESEIIGEAVHAGRTKILATYYELDSGRVESIG